MSIYRGSLTCSGELALLVLGSERKRREMKLTPSIAVDVSNLALDDGGV